MKRGFILWLSELNKDDGDVAGGKGSNLGEMYNSGLPVPPAFVVTVNAYNHFLEKTGINEKIDNIIDKINVDNTKALEEEALKIKKIVIDAKMPDDLRKEILEAYDHFNSNLNELVSSPAYSILKTAREPIFVSVRSSATAEDLSGASFAGQQESFINVKGNDEVIEKVKGVFASIFTARSIYYRKKKGFQKRVGIAAVVQKMINSEKSGVMFSVDPVTQKDDVMIEAVFGQGEGIVSGQIKPDQYMVSKEDLEIKNEIIADKKIAIVRDSQGITKTVQLTPEKSHQRVLKTHEIKDLANYGLRLEKHYNKPQDIEFALEDDAIYILQTRPITTLKENAKNDEVSGNLLLSGQGASPGIASGIVKIVFSMDDLDKVKKGDVLVTSMTNPDMVVTMQKASAIVTDEGGVTAHAAIVSREMGIPCVVGTENATKMLKDGMKITVDGSMGKIYEGLTESKKIEVLPIVETKTKIKVLVDLPDFAERAAKTHAAGIGLVRVEGIIAGSGKHPMYYIKNNLYDEYQRLIQTGLNRIASHFKDKEIWVRTSDIRSDEYSHLKDAPIVERNPMLGMHGIRFSLKNRDFFKAELMAIKKVAEAGNKIGVMFPQVISAKEIEEVKKILHELDMRNKVKLGIMVETPAAVVVIDDLCAQGIQFISFGTNDLTQFTLAIDRGNEEVQYLYNEMDFAILKQISRVIRICKQNKVETSICGQAASRKDMVEFLVKQGIDSISVNADSAYEISKFVKELESRNTLSK